MILMRAKIICKLGNLFGVRAVFLEKLNNKKNRINSFFSFYDSSLFFWAIQLLADPYSTFISAYEQYL